MKDRGMRAPIPAFEEIGRDRTCKASKQTDLRIRGGRGEKCNGVASATRRGTMARHLPNVFVAQLASLCFFSIFQLPLLHAERRP